MQTATRPNEEHRNGNAGSHSVPTTRPTKEHETPTVPTVEVVVPVYNEERAVEENILRLHAYLHEWFPLPTRITIADNASTDDTWRLATELAEELSDVRALHLDAKGRGRALRAAWSLSDAAVVAYMDLDLSTGLSALLPLVTPLLSGHSDVSIGSRLNRRSRVVRGPKRESISRLYNLLSRSASASVRSAAPSRNGTTPTAARTGAGSSKAPPMAG